MHGQSHNSKESYVSLSEDKAKEVLDLCLHNESEEMKIKVYEILSLSDIRVNDPMFLVLALTGQIRVLLEIAPAELKQLLNEWKFQISENMTELIEIISQLKISQSEQREVIQKSIEETNLKGINSIKAINKSLVAEVLSANTEIVLEAKKLIEELTELHARIQSDRKDNIKIMESLIQGIGKTYHDLELMNLEIQSSISNLRLVKTYTSRKWLTSIMLVITALLVFGSFVSFILLARQKSNKSSFIMHDSNQLSLLSNTNECSKI